MTLLTIPSYAYNASAIGLGGVIRKGNRVTVVPTVGSVCLASAGGEAANQVDDYDRDGISFTRAQSRVGGYAVKKGSIVRHSTFAEVLLLNLRIFDRISIARMQAVVTSTREIEDSTDPRKHLQPDQTRFSVKLMYHGVEIDGEEVDAEVDNELCEASSYKDFTGILKRRKPSLPLEEQDLIAATEAVQQYAAPPIGGPLVTVRGKADAAQNRVKVPKFGKAHFGNIVVKQDRQRVSLLRLNLDALWSPEQPSKQRAIAASATEEVTVQELDGTEGGGNVTSGDTGSNGVPIWERG
jgi:hypothetical protein